jgi:hypothetical protein
MKSLLNCGRVVAFVVRAFAQVVNAALLFVMLSYYLICRRVHFSCEQPALLTCCHRSIVQSHCVLVQR